VYGYSCNIGTWQQPPALMDLTCTGVLSRTVEAGAMLFFSSVGFQAKRCSVQSRRATLCVIQQLHVDCPGAVIAQQLMMSCLDRVCVSCNVH
jgi:hypothetical protein